jgi:hypothetical protein
MLILQIHLPGRKNRSVFAYPHVAVVCSYRTTEACSYAAGHSFFNGDPRRDVSLSCGISYCGKQLTRSAGIDSAAGRNIPFCNLTGSAPFAPAAILGNFNDSQTGQIELFTEGRTSLLQFVNRKSMFSALLLI